MMIRKNVLLALSALALASVLLPGCGGKSDDATPDATKNSAVKNREGGDAGTSGAATTPGAGATPTAGSATPAAPDTTANPQSHNDK